MTGDYFTIPIPELHSPEWHEARRLSWNASLAAVLFGEHPYVSLGDACVAKLSGHIEPETAAMARGTRMEPYISDWLADLLSVRLDPPEVMYGRGPLLANPDRLVRDRPEMAIEIKTTEHYLRMQPLRYWWWQAHAQMACMEGVERIVIGALDGSLELRMFEIERDEAIIDQIIRRARRIIAAIQFDEMPGGIELSADNVKVLWPIHQETTVELATPDRLPLDQVRAYLEASRELKVAEDRKRAARNALVTALGANGAGTIDGIPIVTYKASKPSEKFDQHSFAEDHPDLYAAYTKEMPGSRRFHVLKKGQRDLLPDLEPQEEEED